MLENTFTCVADMVDLRFGKLLYFKNFILKNHWRTIDLIREFTIPVHFISGRQDVEVPYQLTE